MANTYADKPTNLKPATLSDGTLADIGRLVRACAEIEDLVTLFIGNLAELSESRASILLGRTAISRRLEIAEYLAALHSEGATALHKHVFNDIFRTILECRNAVAHGVLLGETEDGGLAFLTEKTVEPTGTATVKIVISYLPDQIAALSQYAARGVGRIEKTLKLEELRSERLQRPLGIHRKAQPQRKPSSKNERQPRSSQKSQ